jgi:putative spermidine/putrescine transport system ATP-binding protein
MSTSVKVSNISRVYGNFHALKGVNLDVAPGEFVTLLGPSGSGKSTLLKLLAGFDKPSTGDILIDGKSVVEIPSHLRQIGMVFQNYALFPHMTVAQNIGFPLSVRGVSEQEIAEKVKSVLDIIHMDRFGHRFPRELSGGQQQRVALARAIVFNPKVMLMDEPLGALDRHLREQLKFEIKRIQRQLNMTVLFVTHDQDEALVMSDQVVVMKEGHIEQKASPRDLYNKPRNRFIASFIGESNVLPVASVSPALCDLSGSRHDNEYVMVRPEFVNLHAQRPHDWAMEGIVDEMIFLGESTRFIINTGTASITVKKSNSDLFEAKPGQRVFFDWQSQHGRMIEA